MFGFVVADSFEAGGRVVWALLRNGAAELMINEKPHTNPERANRPRYTDLVLYFAIESVYALQRELLRKGLTPSEPEAHAYGVDEMYLRDADGYELAFTSPTDLTRRAGESSSIR